MRELVHICKIINHKMKIRLYIDCHTRTFELFYHHHKQDIKQFIKCNGNFITTHNNYYLLSPTKITSSSANIDDQIVRSLKFDLVTLPIIQQIYPEDKVMEIYKQYPHAYLNSIQNEFNALITINKTNNSFNDETIKESVIYDSELMSFLDTIHGCKLLEKVEVTLTSFGI